MLPPSRPAAASAVSDADAAALGLDTRPPDFYDPEADDKDEEWAKRMRRCGGCGLQTAAALWMELLCVAAKPLQRLDA